MQRTFNLVVVALEAGSDAEVEIEFSMLDQADFAGIDAYIKRHGLNDASLADSRRAKVYNVNAPKDRNAGKDDPAAPDAMNGANAEGEDDETELQKAERLLQDEEDDEEEDYVDEGSEEDSTEDEDYEDGDQEGYEEGEGEEEEEEEYDEEGGEDEEEG